MQQQNYVVPNSLFPKDLRRYASRKVARRRGELEEKLRVLVGAYVRPDGLRSERGRNKEIADFIGRPPSWVTEYINGENHANLDTSLALLRAMKITISDLAGRQSAGQLLLKKESEPVVEAFEALNDVGRQMALEHLDMLRRRFPLQPQQESAARTHHTIPETARKAHGKR